jgi:hypothetical protein
MRAGSGMRPYTGAEVPVHWVTRVTELHRVGSSYLAYGNEPSLGHMYGNAALFARVPACCRGGSRGIGSCAIFSCYIVCSRKFICTSRFLFSRELSSRKRVAPIFRADQACTVK